jgi:hypothetical protein
LEGIKLAENWVLKRFAKNPMVRCVPLCRITPFSAFLTAAVAFLLRAPWHRRGVLFETLKELALSKHPPPEAERFQIST